MRDGDDRARELLTYLYSECARWVEDVDGDEGRAIITHHVRFSDGLLDELLDIAGIERASYDETNMERLRRANDEDIAALPKTEGE